MNVFHINSNFLTSRLHENLIDKLETLGISNSIYMPMKSSMQDEILYNSKNNVYNPIVFNDVDKYIFTWKQHKIFKKLLKEFRIKDYNLVHAHTLFTDGNIALKLYKKYNIPYVVTVRGRTDLDFFRLRPNLRKRGKTILKNASQIIFLSERDKNQMLDSYLQTESRELESKIKVIPNGIDSFWFDNEGSPKTIENKETIEFIFVGRMLKLKNIPFSVKALNSYARKSSINIKMTIVGKQEDKEILEEIKDIANINISLIENVSKEKLINYYRTNDIFIMPSYPETFGLVYAEAMSQGLPVIYSEKSGFYNQFDEGIVGYGIDHEDINDATHKIDEIVRNYETISKNCIDKYKKFNWDTISLEYKKIYANIS